MHISIKMKKNLIKEIKIPEGVEVSISENIITVKWKDGENKRAFNFGKILVERVENEIILKGQNATKKEKKNMNSITAHIKNMIKGIEKKFEYKLKICFSHFPITVEIKGDEGLIKNFIGERIPRKIKLLKNVDIKVNKDIITVSSCDKELAGQAAANFEKATMIRKRDRRTFQDGIFITSKGEKEIWKENF